MYQNWAEMGRNPGRLTSPRPAGLAPPRTLPRLRSRSNITSSSASEPRIGCRFDRMDRKACTRIKGPTIQRKPMSKSAIHLPGRSQASTCNVGATEGREEPEGGRPAWPCLLSGNASYTDSRRQSGTSTQRRWPDGQNPRPAGLGELISLFSFLSRISSLGVIVESSLLGIPESSEVW